jgi:hypothetical protein
MTQRMAVGTMVPAATFTRHRPSTTGSLPVPTGATRTLPTLALQAERLIELGVHRLAGIAASGLRTAVAGVDADDSLLVLHPDRVPPTALAPLVEHGGKHGFVVVDMPDADDFKPIEGAAPPPGVAYLVRGLDRGDHLANWSPDEALPEIHGAGRTPLTLTEGIHWLLQEPFLLERGHCFMTIASRLRRPDGALDARTPALWISNGTGRDGRDRRNAPKVGWCWAGNRHTWLGFASAEARSQL